MPQFPRHSPETGRIAAEKQLFHELEQTALKLASDGDFGRDAAIDAVKLVSAFLRDRGLSGQALKPLINLRKALEDVERGILPELFDPTAVKRLETQKWSRSSAGAETKIFAAALMDALMRGEDKMTKSGAARRVARSAEKWPRVSSGIITPATVANWRDELLQRMSTDRDRRMFESYSRSFVKGPRASAFLKEVLRTGPPLTDGLRRSKT
jgi:hypothetical protein